MRQPKSWLYVDRAYVETFEKLTKAKLVDSGENLILLVPEDPGVFYMANNQGLYRSADAGQSWERLDSVWTVPYVASVDYPVSTVEPHVRDITIDPENPKTIYAALQVGFMLKSTDGDPGPWIIIRLGKPAIATPR